MLKWHPFYSVLIVCIFILAIAGCLEPPMPNGPEKAESVVIRPDYSGVTIPPNIAPLNFKIQRQADACFVKVFSDSDKGFSVAGKDSKIAFPGKKWHRFLAANAGSDIYFQISLKEKGTWYKYKKIVNTVATDTIDSHLVYRFLPPVYNAWNEIEIKQRDLSGFSTEIVLDGGSFQRGCINCHSFTANSPDRMSIATRSAAFGSASLVVTDNTVEKVNTKWGYTAWHPSGKIAAYSTNKVVQFFHTATLEIRDVADLDSAILYYDMATAEVKTTPSLADKDRLETYPTWSADGKYLYYCSAPVLWEDRNKTPPDNYFQLKYDLMRISYDIETDTWGSPERVLSSKETQKSILLPRLSGDGKYIVFCMCDYGCFPIFQESSDLYVMEVATLKYRKIDSVSSGYSESWHSFSSNSKWLAFSSKTNGGLFTRTYFTHIDDSGNFSKPFILPQKDPEYYDSLLWTFSVPELIKKPIPVSRSDFAKAARATDKKPLKLPITGATPKADKIQPWQLRE